MISFDSIHEFKHFHEIIYKSSGARVCVCVNFFSMLSVPYYLIRAKVTFKELCTGHKCRSEYGVSRPIHTEINVNIGVSFVILIVSSGLNRSVIDFC